MARQDEDAMYDEESNTSSTPSLINSIHIRTYNHSNSIMGERYVRKK